ncbi:MAG: sigma 54-interacting transcriptional regulator [Acidobacteria bacterium]|nr:sigma 54-interacting transcriptional regulator [Acidobacteriota bacterium]
MKHISSLSRLSALMAGGLGHPANYNPVMDILRDEFSAEKAFLLLLSESGELAPVASAGVEPAHFRKLEAVSAASRLGSAVETLAPLVIDDLSKDASLAFLIDGNAKKLFAFPIKLAGRPAGVLAIIAAPGAPPANEIEPLVSVVASMIGQDLRVDRSVMGERRKLLEENTHLKQELKEKYTFKHIVGTSNPMKQVYEQVTQVARSNATVLLRGESGTGKEMIANAIHYNSLRAKRPFVRVNCAALPDTLIEAELFGHEQGAFTGAGKAKKGRFELADGGTLFLDEIGDIPLQTQVKLLRVLQEREFERLGGTATIKTNIRLITATSRDLEEAIAEGSFREDLYYRLNVFSIFMPPLRERKTDILLLAEHFLEKFEAEHGKRIRRISTPAIDMLMSYHFPGNVRELENAIERAVLVCDSNVIHGHHLPPTLQTAEVTGTVTDLSLEAAVAAFEKDMIQDALKSNKGNIAKAARLLGSTERIIGYKIKKYSIDPHRFKK